MINLDARIMRLEEQIQRIEFSETSMDEGGAFWRRGDDGDERQGWNGTWWIRVEQQDLNSGQRRKISRRLLRMIIREKNGMASLLRELRNGMRWEEMTSRYLSTFSESADSMKNEEMSTDGTHQRIQSIQQ